MEKERNKLSIIVPCYNNEEIIKDCLESACWADEILVCDSFSTDKTLEIARKYAGRIIQHEYINSATQKNWAIPQAVHEWVFILDTDERISKELKQEIISVLSDPRGFSGFKVPRANYGFGKQLHHGGYWPDYQLRLFKRDKGKYALRDVHAHVILDGAWGVLKNPLMHYHDRTFMQVVKKLLIRYSRWEATERLKREEPRLWKLFLKPPAVFMYRFFNKKGFMDGARGFLAASLWASYIFMTYLNMFFLKKNPQQWKEKK